MRCRHFTAESVQLSRFGEENHALIKAPGFLQDPEAAISSASLQDFASISPHYPGVRSPVLQSVLDGWLSALSPVLDHYFGQDSDGWSIEGWHSLVTTPADRLQPIQRLPHTDGVDPSQIAMMLYLHRTPHGGTAFFRHKSTGFESLSAERFPVYKERLERDVAAGGLPQADYADDGSPYFERIGVAAGEFNCAVFYRGNVFHSGVIARAAPLSADPRSGRYTINAFIRPLRGA